MSIEIEESTHIVVWSGARVKVDNEGKVYFFVFDSFGGKWIWNLFRVSDYKKGELVEIH